MKGILGGIVAIILISIVLQLITPWWIIVVISAAVGFAWNLSYLQSFLMGFIALFLLWSIHAFILNFENDSILSSQIGALMGDLPPVILILLTGLTGGIPAGIGCLVGKASRSIVA